MVSFPKHIEIYNEELQNDNILNEKQSCCNRSFCWWSPPRDFVLVQFCEDTHLHGLKYLGKLKNIAKQEINFI